MLNELAFLITHPDNVFFSVCAVVCLILLLMQFVTAVLGIGSLGDSNALDLETTSALPEVFSASLSWLGVGRIPMMIWLFIFFGGWSMHGFIFQSLSFEIFGDVLSWWIALPLALSINFPSVHLSCKIFGPLIPHNESYAISTQDLIGGTATITIGTAKAGNPTEAKIVDRFGSTHYIMIEPELSEDVFVQGEVVTVTEIHGNFFKGIKLNELNTNNLFSD